MRIYMIGITKATQNIRLVSMKSRDQDLAALEMNLDLELIHHDLFGRPLIFKTKEAANDYVEFMNNLDLYQPQMIIKDENLCELMDNEEYYEDDDSCDNCSYEDSYEEGEYMLDGSEDDDIDTVICVI